MKIVKWTTLLSIFSSMALVSVNVIAGPNAGGGNEDCPTGTTQVAKFETTNNGQYNAEGNANGVVISGANLKGGNWTSTVPIYYVIVKGGSQGAVPNDVRISYSGTFSNGNLPKNKNGQPPDISNIKFCQGPVVNNPPVVTCSAKVCESLQKTNILVDTIEPSDYQSPAEAKAAPWLESLVPVNCVVTQNGNLLSGATVVVTAPTGGTPISVTTGANGAADFEVPHNWTLNSDLVGIVNPYWSGGYTSEEVDIIRTATYALLPLQTDYTVTATKENQTGSYTGAIKLAVNDVIVEHIPGNTPENGHPHGHVKFTFYDGCTITDGEDEVPAGLRVWQPIQGLTGVLPGDTFSEGTHYSVVKPEQAEYILEKIDSAGNSTFVPVQPKK